MKMSFRNDISKQHSTKLTDVGDNENRNKELLLPWELTLQFETYSLLSQLKSLEIISL